MTRLIGCSNAGNLRLLRDTLLSPSHATKRGFRPNLLAKQRPFTWSSPRAETQIYSNTVEASNKPEGVLINQRTYQYLLQHTHESEALQRLRQETAAEWPNAKKMQVSPEQGRFLSWLVGALGVKQAIEVGVFTGYSAVCIAQALPPDGLLLACESDKRPLKLAHRAFADAGVVNKVNLQLGKAAQTLQLLLDNSHHDQFDFAFVDADKRGYWQYHEMLLRLVRRGGVLVYDNMLWYGAVADPEDNRKATVALRTFNDQLMSDSRVDVSLVPIGDGMALCKRL